MKNRNATHRLRDRIRAGIGLLKAPIGAANACTALLGYAALRPAASLNAALVVSSLFILCCGAGALNNYQDRRLDALMKRTENRPLPRGVISAGFALVLSLALIAAGLGGLYAASESPAASAAGACAVVLYNGIYTPLRRKNSLAIIPGVFCGAIPPLAGWLAAGGQASDPLIWFLMALLAIWQVPHYGLIILRHGRDYLRSGVPTIMNRIPFRHLKLLSFLWLFCYSLAILNVFMLGLLDYPPFVALLAVNAVLLCMVAAFCLLRKTSDLRLRFLFHYLNASAMAVALAVVVNSIL